jgi:hypothetical protein
MKEFGLGALIGTALFVIYKMFLLKHGIAG